MSGATGPEPTYLRAIISFELRTLSPLHCGDGGSLAASEAAWPGLEQPQGHINTACMGEDRDGNPRPYIPASTLRGSLRERCPQPDRLFGTARGDQGTAGAVRVYDAFLEARDEGPPGDRYWNPARGTTLRTGVSLDPLTGTAVAAKLFNFEIVPDDARARVQLEADRVTEAELVELLGLVHAWDGSAVNALGRGRSRGWGRVELVSTRTVRVLTENEVREWLCSDSDAAPQWRVLDSAIRVTTAPSAGVVRQCFRLEARSPILMNEPGRVRTSAESEGHEPALEYMRTASGQAVIPGSSLRGAVRARAARILATLAYASGDAPDGTELTKAIAPLLDALFGTERFRSPIWFADAHAPEHNEHVQHFNAIDRFTGGVSDGALYAVTAAACDYLEGEVTLELRRLPSGDWWKALLLFLARDLMEGDIPIGWGKSRGFGAVHACLTDADGRTLAGFPDLVQALRAQFGHDEPARWVAALNGELQGLRRARPGGETL